MTDLEQQIAEILNVPCGYGEYEVHKLRDCPVCLPKRIAAAIEAAWVEPGWSAGLEAALRALKGEP